MACVDSNFPPLRLGYTGVNKHMHWVMEASNASLSCLSNMRSA